MLKHGAVTRTSMKIPVIHALEKHKIAESAKPIVRQHFDQPQAIVQSTVQLHSIYKTYLWSSHQLDTNTRVKKNIFIRSTFKANLIQKLINQSNKDEKNIKMENQPLSLAIIITWQKVYRTANTILLETITTKEIISHKWGIPQPKETSLMMHFIMTILLVP